jgi:hypothetical protein
VRCTRRRVRLPPADDGGRGGRRDLRSAGGLACGAVVRPSRWQVFARGFGACDWGRGGRGGSFRPSRAPRCRRGGCAPFGAVDRASPSHSFTGCRRSSARDCTACARTRPSHVGSPKRRSPHAIAPREGGEPAARAPPPLASQAQPLPLWQVLVAARCSCRRHALPALHVLQQPPAHGRAAARTKWRGGGEKRRRAGRRFSSYRQAQRA